LRKTFPSFASAVRPVASMPTPACYEISRPIWELPSSSLITSGPFPPSFMKFWCAAAGRKIARVILTHEAGRDGFWLARFLARRGIEVHVIQPSSLPVDRRARRAKTDIIDVEMLLRTFDGLATGRASGLFDGADPERSR
jgi:hypothetical protein